MAFLVVRLCSADKKKFDRGFLATSATAAEDWLKATSIVI